MKEIFKIIAITLILVGCSNDGNNDPNQMSNPIITSLSKDSGRIGDFIRINGENFDLVEKYVVRFNGVEGTITERKSTFLEVQIPERATSGEVTLSYGDKNQVIGSIEIISENQLVYAIKSNFVSATETTKFVSIDPTNGEKQNLLDLQTTDNFESTSINKSTNQIFFVTSLGDGNTDTEIYTIDVSANKYSMANLNEDPEIDYQLLSSSTGTLFAIKHSYVSDVITSKLVSINATNGEETLVLDLKTTDNFNSLVYSSQANKIYAVTNIGDGNLDCEIYSIDLKDNSYSSSFLSNEFHYELAITENGNLYGLEQTFDNTTSAKIYKLDPEIGSKSLVIDLETTDSFNNLISKGNSLIGTSNIDFPNIESEIYTIDLQNTTFSYVSFNDDNGIDFKLVN